MDRRSTGGSRRAKGIYADQSWDRWLEQYWHNKYNPKPKKKRVVKVVKVNYIPKKDAFRQAYTEYDKYGYQAALDLLQNLYSEDKISLIVKSELVNELVGLRMMTSKERKYFIKLQNNA